MVKSNAAINFIFIKWLDRMGHNLKEKGRSATELKDLGPHWTTFYRLIKDSVENKIHGQIYDKLMCQGGRTRMWQSAHISEQDF